eukprot:GFUD01028602.1.p1 GENE.GFUD01028602.1~~GFUD01028602.1.p1  ORF type:complete len:104 (+),score=31.76 GFUD01028602.1:328-639(+)
MFSFKPNPHYVPGGVTNFWLSGSWPGGGGGGSHIGEVERTKYGKGADGDGGAVLQRMGRVGGGGFGAAMRSSFCNPQKEESQKPVPKESCMEGFNPLGNKYSV